MTRLDAAKAASVAVLVLAAPAQAAAQVPQDTIELWASRLRTGSLIERVEAMGKLSHVETSDLGPAARQALVDELNRVHGCLLGDEPLTGSDDLVGEDLGAYYMDLVVAVTHLRTPEADLALVPAVAVSLGTARRVARLGDRSVPLLAALIERRYETASALETRGLAWFWADSTGAALSEDSRGVIAAKLTDAARNDTFTVALGGASALYYTGDPGFLPLARFMEARAVENGLPVLGYLRVMTLPALEAAASGAGPLDLARSAARITSALCADADPGPRRGVCTALGNEWDTALRHLAAGRPVPARNTLEAIVQRLAAAARTAALAPAEIALVEGGARQVLGAL